MRGQRSTPGYARYRYLRRSSLSRSRNSRSMRLSTRFLMMVGFGTKRDCNCLVTSAMTVLWSITRRLLSNRTMAASICGLRSSSTLVRVSCFSASLSFCADTMPILILTSLEVNFSLKEKTSLWLISLLCGSLRSTFLPLTHARLCSERLRSDAGISVAAAICSYDRRSASLKSSRMHSWYVVTFRSCHLLANCARTSAVPMLVCQVSRRPV
mmetsp:Transcript_9893/g.30991  ORF Transcript_9893/g.30991 Transcript_9893/m.30991 type:complete len:212 (+) Transcript_9893:117-752(+)